MNFIDCYSNETHFSTLRFDSQLLNNIIAEMPTIQVGIPAINAYGVL